MSGADVDAPPLLSANEEGDGYGSETPPHLDIEQSDHGSLDVNSGKARHSQSIGVESTNLSQEISEGRRERAHAQMAALSNQVQFA
ncbi:unnamed protein product [Toxocara canis]|nr:unnamed protein product [Toxocara canis]